MYWDAIHANKYHFTGESVANTLKKLKEMLINKHISHDLNEFDIATTGYTRSFFEQYESCLTKIEKITLIYLIFIDKKGFYLCMNHYANKYSKNIVYNEPAFNIEDNLSKEDCEINKHLSHLKNKGRFDTMLENILKN